MGGRDAVAEQRRAVLAAAPGTPEDACVVGKELEAKLYCPCVGYGLAWAVGWGRGCCWSPPKPPASRAQG